MAYWRLYYHLVWATKQRLPLITAEREGRLYPYIIAKADSLGCIIHAIGGIEDHIHIVVYIPPKLVIADFVKNIKGSSAHFLNQHSSNQEINFLASKFVWQEGYGVFSLGSKQLQQAVDYAKNQKIHHLQGTAIAALETDKDN